MKISRTTLSYLVRAVLILAGMITSILLAFGGLMWFLFPPLSPVPEPYPGAVVATNEHGVGNWGQMREQTYLVNRSLAEMEQYYKEQMSLYCRVNVEFAEQPKGTDSWPCRDLETLCYVAACKIPSRDDRGPIHGQWFDVQLYAIDDSTTKVIQITSWTD